MLLIPLFWKKMSGGSWRQQARGRSTAARVVMRSRIVLLASEGLQNKQIAEKLQIAPRMVALWRGTVPEVGHGGPAERCAPGLDARHRFPQK